MTRSHDTSPQWRNRIVGEGLEDPEQLLANPFNARIHPKFQQDSLKAVLDEVGWVDRVIVNRTSGHVLDGHLRVALAITSGEQVPVEYVELNDHEEKLILGVFDWITQQAIYDEDSLDVLLKEIGDTDNEALQALLDDLATQNNISLLDEEPLQDLATQIDKAAELQAQWKTARGQVWVIPSKTGKGVHRLMCGDSTNADDVGRLLGGQMVDACVTDPPYGVGVDYGDFPDTEANVNSLVDKFMPIIQALNVPIALTPGVPAMWSYPKPTWLMMWVHPAPSGRCPWGFAGVNPILVYGKDPYLAAGMGGRPDSIVMASDRQGVDGHPTPKPIEVWKWLIERLTVKEGQKVFDPFSGSGTGLVACEQLKRICYTMELAPEYVAVALQRLSDIGLTPRLDTHEIQF